MRYWRALRERDRALAASRTARGDFAAAVGRVIGVYQAQPMAMLAAAAGVGFVLAQLRVGGRWVRIGARIASGPAWRILKTVLDARA